MLARAESGHTMLVDELLFQNNVIPRCRYVVVLLEQLLKTVFRYTLIKAPEAYFTEVQKVEQVAKTAVEKHEDSKGEHSVHMPKKNVHCTSVAVAAYE